MRRKIHMENCAYNHKCIMHCSCPWPSGLRRGSVAARLLRLWARNPPTTWMSVSCECCILPGTGLFVELITRREEPYLVWCVWVWLRSLHIEEALVHQELQRHEKKKKSILHALCWISSCLHSCPVLLKLSTPHKMLKGPGLTEPKFLRSVIGRGPRYNPNS